MPEKSLIKNIIIEFDGKKLDLSLDQALKLRDELNQLFAVKTEYIPYPVRTYYPPHTWYQTLTGDSLTLSWQSY